MEPWLSWTLALGIGGGAAYYYTQTGKPKGSKSIDKAQPPTGKGRQDKSPQLGNTREQSAAAGALGSGTGDANSTKNRKGGSKKAQQGKPAAQHEHIEASPISEAEDDDQEWAEQLRAAQKGVTVNGTSTAGKSGKTKGKKQTENGIGLGTDSKVSRPAREDKAEANTEPRPSGSNVADMLEAPTAGPSVMRLTGEAKPQKPKIRAASPEKETKKQRQNRKKAEEKKAAREQDEQERKVLQENQRRAAREARGEPSKNGVPAAPPALSAWADKPKSANPAAVNGNKSTMEQMSSEDNSLLDTFDHDTMSNTSSNEPPTSSTTPASTTSVFSNGLPSEQAQHSELDGTNTDGGWNEVSKGRKGKKKTAAQAEVAEADRGAPIQNEKSATQQQVAVAPPTAILGGYGDDFVKGMTSKKFHEGDSDWFVE